MGTYPVDPTIQKSFRDTLAVPWAPAYLTTEDISRIVPVAVVAVTSTASASQFVKITDGTDTALVNTDGSLQTQQNISYPITRPTILNAVARATAAGTTTVATVSGGKTAYIVAYSITTTAGTTANSRLDLRFNGVIKHTIDANGFAAAADTVVATVTFAPGMEPAVAATLIIDMVGTGANNTFNAMVWYYEL